MKRFLRSLRTGKYLRSFRSWTLDLDAAREFRSTAQALEAVRHHSLRDMELVLTDVPVTVTLFELLVPETEDRERKQRKWQMREKDLSEYENTCSQHPNRGIRAELRKLDDCARAGVGFRVNGAGL